MKHIRTVGICRVRVPIVRASYALVPELREADGTLLDGWFDVERGIVFVRDGLEESLERDAVNHELLHALLYYSGAREFLDGVVKKKVAPEWEETLIRILTPHVSVMRWSSK